MPASPEPRGRIVLPPLAPAEADAFLRPPLLPPAAAAIVPVARRAAAARVPVRLAVASGLGLRLARALHAVAGHAGPLLATSTRRPPLATLPPDAALYVDVALLAPEALLALEALLDDAAVWVLVATAPGARVPPGIAQRCAAVTFVVPPLAERRAELPALAATVLDRLATRVGRAAPGLSATAVAQLEAYPWPGDLPELEATVARAFLEADGDTIDRLPVVASAPAAGAAVAAPAAATAPTGDAGLEFVLAELAHELRNPMVTIKTFARHLPEMLEDAPLRERFAGLCDEAVGRMDGLLENVLAFARFGRPAPRALDVAPVLARVLTEVEPELSERAIRVRQPALTTAHCAADPEQLDYALRNLFAGIVREVPPREEVVLDASVNGVVTLRFATGGEAAERLRRLAAPADADEVATLADPTLLPLSFRLARAVLERNGGTLAVVPDAGDTTTVVVRLPTAAAG